MDRDLVALFLAIPLGTMLYAVLLRAAVALYHKMAGGAESPYAVPIPGVAKAMTIVFLAFLVFGGTILLDIFFNAPLTTRNGWNLSVLMIVPVSLLVLASLLTALLPTSFGRAVLVTLCFALIIGVLFGLSWFPVMILNLRK